MNVNIIPECTSAKASEIYITLTTLSPKEIQDIATKTNRLDLLENYLEATVALMSYFYFDQKLKSGHEDEQWVGDRRKEELEKASLKTQQVLEVIYTEFDKKRG